MGSRNISKGVNHRQDNQPERQRHPEMRDGPVTDSINDDRARACENERKGAEEF